jgi:uncharacterized protein YukE
MNLRLVIPKAKNFQDVYKQWHFGQPEKNLNKALKDFTSAEKNQRDLKSTYSKRATIMADCRRLGETIFQERYADCLKKVDALYEAVKGSGDTEEGPRPTVLASSAKLLAGQKRKRGGGR